MKKVMGVVCAIILIGILEGFTMTQIIREDFTNTHKFVLGVFGVVGLFVILPIMIKDAISQQPGEIRK